MAKFIWLGKDCWSGNVNTHQTHQLHKTPKHIFFGNWTLALSYAHGMDHIEILN